MAEDNFLLLAEDIFHGSSKFFPHDFINTLTLSQILSIILLYIETLTHTEDSNDN